MAKLVWRVKVVADLGWGAVSETEVARIEREDFAVPETVGLSSDEGKQLAAAIQAEIVGSQAAVMGERFRWCEHCGAKLWSKGYYPATFRSLFGDVPVKVRRLSACRCRSISQEPKSFRRHDGDWWYRARAGVCHGEVCCAGALCPGG